MRRFVASLVGVALLSFVGSAGLHHVHAYGDHDHADHAHGVTAHSHYESHSHSGSDHDSEFAAFEACDPEDHAVFVAIATVQPDVDESVAPPLLRTAVLTLPEPACWTTLPEDARAHSPPRLTDAPLRAPPLVRPA